MNEKQLENEICQLAQTEGIGSIYERIVLSRLFRRLIKDYQFRTVAEFGGLEITKGYDNLAFLLSGKRVTLVGNNCLEIKKNWKPKIKPEFCLPQTVGNKKFDLVWNFAVLQVDPNAVSQALGLTSKYFLFFAPNFLNLGMPAHLLYHWITRTECKHAERGSILARTRFGLTRLIEKNGGEVIKSGYIDIPPIPDIGFSIRELKTHYGLPVKSKVAADFDQQTMARVEKLGVIEKLPLPEFARFFFAHHIYAFGKIG